MLKVGLTGGIGSGKSTIAKVFELLSVPVYYADLEARKLINNDPDIRSGIINAFGEESYVAKELNRSYISSIVFNNEEKLMLLNSITHPATIKHADQWMVSQQTPYVIKEAALLFESDAFKHLDFIIGVSCPLELRIKRIMDRDRISRDQIELRMSRQMNEEEKLERCDAIIINDETLMIIPQVLALHKKFLLNQ